MEAAVVASPEVGFDHPALLYQSRQEYLAATLGFVKSARTAGLPTLVAVPPDRLELIRSALGPDTDATGTEATDTEVTFADMTVAGRNPGRILPLVLLDFADRHAGRRVAIIGEPVWPQRRDVEYPACVAHEALINEVFAGRDATILCPYDALHLPPHAVADAFRTHPVIQHRDSRWSSTTYTDPTRLVAEFNQPLPDPPATAVGYPLRDTSDLEPMRRLVATSVAEAGLDERRAAQLLVAVCELASNSIQHSGGPGRVRLWTDETDIVCQVEDGGHLTDVMAGRIPPSLDQLGGRGLILVNALCDLVRVYTRPGHTVVRVYLRRDPQVATGGTVGPVRPY